MVVPVGGVTGFEGTLWVEEADWPVPGLCATVPLSVWLVRSIKISDFIVPQCEQSELGKVLVVVVLISLWQMLQSRVSWLMFGLGGVA